MPTVNCPLPWHTITRSNGPLSGCAQPAGTPEGVFKFASIGPNPCEPKIIRVVIQKANRCRARILQLRSENGVHSNCAVNCVFRPSSPAHREPDNSGAIRKVTGLSQFTSGG